VNRSDSSCEECSEESAVHFIRPKKRRMRFWMDEAQEMEVGGVSDEEEELDAEEHATCQPCGGPVTGNSGGEEEEEESGERKPRKVQDPKEPTAEERRMHDLTHMPFRSWCRHCVRGRGKEEPCRKTDDSQERGP